ncbi:hypothetical protein [Chitinophaga polysaccharea]|uniref:hypothetical protein n=1 Tax=Chitinophaga polysaccharea TaxID=1293035 RepID=UPI00115B8CF1|nr:hypothetical protein [Chitinophaga polysaccharea]
MEKTKELGYGQEFRVNDNGVLYPAYLPQEDLQLLAYKFTSYLLGAIDRAEVKVVQTHDGKGLDWEITQFSEGADDKPKLRICRKYTLSLWPSWKVCGCHDHWLSYLTPRCQYSDTLDRTMQVIVDEFRTELKHKYSDGHRKWFFPQLDKYLRNRNWTNIISIYKKSFSQQPLKVDRRAKEIRDDAKWRRKINLKNS